MMLDGFVRIFNIKDTGICECCSYGYENCLKDGQPFCENKDKEVNNREKDSV